jgi:hypothetical protein
VVGLDLPAQEAIQIARHVLATEGYQSVAVGATAATFVRDVRPSRITIAAYACAIPTLGLSLLALLIRSQQQCTVTGETSRYGTALSLSGVVTTKTLEELESALRRAGGHQTGGPQTGGPQTGGPQTGGHLVGGPQADEVYSQFPTPGRGSPVQRPVPSANPLLARPPASGRSAASDPLPTPPSTGGLGKGPQSSFPAEERDLTMVRPSPLAVGSTRRIVPNPSGPRWVVVLDDGRTIDVPDFALIGRDPEPAEDDPEAGLVSLIDPEKSVSKTHASFGVDDEGLWFLDRYSTNGTSMKAVGGERIGLEPGIATPVTPGSEVWIGRRHLRIDYTEE